MQKEQLYSGSTLVYRDISASSFIPEKTYSTVSFDTGYSPCRIMDIIGSRRGCEHKVVSRQTCSFCKAFVGWIGSEREVSLFSHHIYSLLYLRYFDSDFMVFSKRLVPLDFIYKSIAGTVLHKGHDLYHVYLSKGKEYANVFVKKKEKSISFGRPIKVYPCDREMFLNRFFWGDRLYLNYRDKVFNRESDYVICQK